MVLTTDTRGCLQRIKDVYNKLNTAEKKAAQYILENPSDIIHFSITELADGSKVSETTIFRLCNKIGYKGYQELKIRLAGAFMEPIQNIHEEIKEEDNMYIIMHKILNSNMYSIENTMKINKSEELDRAVEMILKAEQLLFFGMGGSEAIATDACNKFIRTGIRCLTSTDSHYQAILAALVKKDDVIFAFSYSGSNKELIESIKIGRDNGAKVISVTSNAKSPIERVSDIILTSYGKEYMYRSEAMESRITSLILIDCLYVGVALKRKKETLETLEKIREVIALKRY